MISISAKARTAVAAILAVSTLAVAAAPAQAGHRGRNIGIGVAALGGGLLLGSAIANSHRGHYYGGARYYARECWTEKRKRYDEDGYRYYVRVRVCN